MDDSASSYLTLEQCGWSGDLQHYLTIQHAVWTDHKSHLTAPFLCFPWL